MPSSVFAWGLSLAPCWRSVRSLEGTISAIFEPVRCHSISGTFELRVASRNLISTSQFDRGIVINLHTSCSLGEVKPRSALPLEHLKRSATQAQAG